MKCKNWSNKLNNFVVRKLKSFKINGQQQVLSSTMPAMPNEKTTPISLDDSNFDEIKMKEHQLVGTSSSTSTSSSSSNTSVKLIKCNNGSQCNRNSKNISYCCNYEDCCNSIGNLSLNGLSTTTSTSSSSITNQQQQQQQTDSSIIQQTTNSNGIILCNNISNNSNNYCNNSNNQYIISTTSTSSSSSITNITTPITYKSRHSLNNIIKASSDCCSSTKLANNLLNYNNSTTTSTSTTTPTPSSSSTTTSTIQATITATNNRLNNTATGYRDSCIFQRQNYINDATRKINGITTKSSTPTIQQQQQQNRQQQQQNSRSNVPIKKSVNDFIFGKYIGEGSFSTVYLASDIHTKKEYAIKVCEKHHIIREKKQEYIKREREVMHLVSNVPGFVNLYCTFQDDSRLYFAMTHAKHGDLLPYINKVGSFDLECTQHYAAELVLACENMHKRGIIHRDLKPENILLDENMHTLIADFGSAKILDNNSSQNIINVNSSSNNSVAGSSPPSTTTPIINNRTNTTTSRTINNHQHQKSDSSDGGCASTDSDADINNESSNRRRRKCSFVGTAQYVTPEILQNGPITRSVDLWALGCIIYQMISGLPPFRGTNDYFIFKEILGLNLIFPDGFNKNAEDLVRKLLKINPIERLGAQDKTDIYESIREHKFFDGINWDTIRTKTPPPIYPYLPGVNKDEELRSQYRVPDNLEPGLDNIKLTRLLGLSLLGYEAGNNKTEPEGDIDLTDEIDKQQNIEAQKIDNWDAFADGEVILKKGFINKRKGLFARKRMLLLTSRPRLIYIDPVQMVKKGEIPWSSELRVEPKNFKIFFVHTPNRTYYLEDPEGYALNWVDAIENIRKSTYNNQSS